MRRSANRLILRALRGPHICIKIHQIAAERKPSGANSAQVNGLTIAKTFHMELRTGNVNGTYAEPSSPQEVLYEDAVRHSATEALMNACKKFKGTIDRGRCILR